MKLPRKKPMQHNINQPPLDCKSRPKGGLFIMAQQSVHLFLLNFSKAIITNPFASLSISKRGWTHFTNLHFIVWPIITTVAKLVEIFSQRNSILFAFPAGKICYRLRLAVFGRCHFRTVLYNQRLKKDWSGFFVFIEKVAESHIPATFLSSLDYGIICCQFFQSGAFCGFRVADTPDTFFLEVWILRI